MSKNTKKHLTKSIIYKILGFCVAVAPMMFFVGLSFIEGETTEKLIMGITTSTAVIFFVLNTLMKYSIRSTLWILLIGVCVTLDNITTLIIITAIGTVIDEFIFSPLYKHHKTKYTINKEIDIRG